MRDFKGMKRQRGRNRGGGGGGKPNTGNINRAFDSNGPDGVKIRGAPQHVYEKYQQLARDAASSGDRVLLENYLQHAEHYFRLIRTLQPQRQPAEIMGRESYTSGYDIDFEDESGEPVAVPPPLPEGEAPAEGSGDDQGQREEGRRDEGRRDDREFRRDREGGREGRDRDFNREPRPEGQRDRGEFREGRDRDRPRRDRDFDRDRRPERAEGEGRRGYGMEPRAEGRPERRDEQPRESAPEADAAVEDDGQVLRDANGGFSPAPAFLQGAPAPAVVSEEDEEERPARARRRRAKPESDDGDAPEASEAPETEEV